MTRHIERLLNYWWVLELFNPPNIPQLTTKSEWNHLHRQEAIVKKITDWRRGDIFPWSILPAPLTRRTKYGEAPYKWKHTIYLGVHQKSLVYELLSQLYGADQEADEFRTAGESAAAAFVIDHAGRIKLDSFILSSAVWASANANPGKPEKLGNPEDFKEAETNITEQIIAHEIERVRKKIGVYRVDGTPRSDEELLARQLPVDYGVFTLLTEMVYQSIGMSPDNPTHSYITRISSEQVREDDGDDHSGNPDNFLNSFQLEELGDVLLRSRKGELGKTLCTYLSKRANPVYGTRQDVIEDPQSTNRILEPQNIPAGRWPSNPQHHLARAQQFTVNRVLANPSGAGQLFGVNGPPGTGKTTLLRDVIAGMVTERACAMAKFANPAAVFGTRRIKYRDDNGKDRYFTPPDSSVTGYEMVIASSNNGAVENVSTEIPDRAAIDSDTWEGADYFTSIATALLHEVRNGYKKENIKPVDAWGILAARLGNKNNRHSYIGALMYGSAYTPVDGAEPIEVPGLLELLDSKSHIGFYPDWEEARVAFKNAWEKVDYLNELRINAYQRNKTLKEVEAHLAQLEERKVTVEGDLQISNITYQNAHENLTRIAERKTAATLAYERSGELKPGFLANLFSFGRAGSTWRSQHEQKIEDLTSSETAFVEGCVAYEEAQGQCIENQKTLEYIRTSITTAQKKTVELNRQIQRDREEYGSAYHVSTDDISKELTAPWLTEEYDKARSDLFLRALDLHRAFILDSRTNMKQRLKIAGAIIKGSMRNAPPVLVKAAWQVFFLTVPTVSSTFASIPRMFSGLGRESLGWLLIDEAGQANPQDAVGSLWRAKNALVVGDPLQLEPVTTMPAKSRRGLADYFNISGEWVPPQASVQTLVDRVALYGTYLGQGSERRWVSSPLRVHRRCESPMFDISNKVAYEGMMISDTRVSQSWYSENADVFQSAWAHVPSQNRGQKVQEAELRRFREMIDYLAAQGVEYSDIIAISPFRAVANRLRKMQKDYPGLTAGTVHTAQGKEASVVAFILGSDPDKDGSRGWAASSPNLVNVAASRAKRRLYVFGDYDKWATHPYFSDMAKLINKKI